MYQVLAGCLLLVACVSGHSYYNYHEIAKFADAVNNTLLENNFLHERADMVKDQKGRLDETLSQYQDLLVSMFSLRLTEHVGRLSDIAGSVKEQLHRLGELEGRLAGEMSIATRNEQLIDPTWTEETYLETLSLRQNAPLQQAFQVAENTIDKVFEFIFDQAEIRQALIDEIEINAQQYLQLVNTKKCFVDYVHVEIDPDTSEGTTTLPVPGSFFQTGVFAGDNIPKVTCGIQGFISKMDLDFSHGYGHGGYYDVEDELQNAALTVDCKAGEDSIIIKAFDQSRGHGNTIATLYVEAQVCSFANMAGFL